MEKEKIRVLVVDDYVPWRRFLCSKLETHTYLQVVGLAADGSEALEKMMELRPDLVLLDIGLPKIDGIELIGHIRSISPQTRILMISETRSAEVAEEAFRRGANGYLVKSDAGHELLRGIDTILEGKRFRSAHLSGYTATRRNEEDVSARFGPVVETVSSPSPKPAEHSHKIEFFSDESAFVAGLARYVEMEMAAQNAVIVVTTASHRASLLHALNERGLETSGATERGDLFLLDTLETLSAWVVDSRLDTDRVTRMMQDIVTRAGRNADGSRRGVAICGECAPILLRQGNIEGAIQLENLTDDILRICGANLLCGYVWSAFPTQERRAIVDRICAAHTEVHGHDGWS